MHFIDSLPKCKCTRQAVVFAVVVVCVNNNCCLTSCTKFTLLIVIVSIGLEKYSLLLTVWLQQWMVRE